MTRNVTAPLALLGTGAVMAAANFEKSMNKVAAVTGATGGDFTKLTEQAKTLGETTQFSASQAAEAMGFLGMAGFDTSQIMAAMPATLDLAAAGALDLASAADIASNIISGFGAEAKDLAHFSDVLAKGFTSSNTNLEQLGDAMSYVAPVASGFGITVEETVAALGKLSDAGIQASMAGTGLKGVLSRLSSQQKQLGINTFDAAGKMRPLSDIIDEIKSKGHSTSKIMEIFGDRAGPSMLALLKVGGKGLRDFTTELENSGGTAKQIADTQLKGFTGSITKLKSALEGIAIEFGDILIPVLSKFIEKIKEGIKFIKNLTDEQKINAVKWIALAAAIGPVLIVLSKMATLLTVMTANPLMLILGGLTLLAYKLKKDFTPAVDDAYRAERRLYNLRAKYGKDLDSGKRTAMGQLNVGFMVGTGKENVKKEIESTAKGIDTLTKALGKYVDMPIAEVPYMKDSVKFKELRQNLFNATEDLGNLERALKTIKETDALAALDKQNNLDKLAADLEAAAKAAKELSELTLLNEALLKQALLAEQWGDRWLELGKSIADSFSSAFAQAVTAGGNMLRNLGNVFVSLLRQLAAMVIKAAVFAGIMTALTGGSYAGKAVAGAKNFATLFQANLTGRASGGPVAGNTPYLVGEAGPEIFMSGAAGHITPNHKLGGTIIPDVRISGSDLLIVFNKTRKEEGGVNV
tara:strand:- start:1745 stop:3826 length:2082 start_codon:yes stop_codon:yes gene_type:complete